jgi:hypothetical protein
MMRFAASAALLAITSATVEARDLWSLYVYEQAVSECGLQLTEDQEDHLDAAQLRARVALNLSPREAGELYRRAREAVRASRYEACAEALHSRPHHDAPAGSDFLLGPGR